MARGGEELGGWRDGMQARDSFSHRKRYCVLGTTGSAILCGQVLPSTQGLLRPCAPCLLYLTRLVVDWVLTVLYDFGASVGESCRANDACPPAACHAMPMPTRASSFLDD